jgi:thiamine-monophosphate kinase
MPRRPTIAEAGEFGLLARLLPTLRIAPDVIVGPGDDCAVVGSRSAPLLLTVDALVEGVHFQPDWLTPAQLGRKAFLVNASDIAAMGGVPRWCVLHVSAPRSAVAGDLATLIRAVGTAASKAGASLVGGNLSRARELSITVALVGDAPQRPVTRRGARPGDLLYVTGALGEAALGLRELRRNAHARSPAVRRFRQPPLRLRAGALLARAGLASAMIDVSDGLIQDLRHLCAASRVGARLALDRIPAPPRVRRAGPLLALTGGEDYELLCAVPTRHRRRVERLAARFGCPFTCIGSCVPARAGLRVVDAQGNTVSVTDGGHDHFAGGRRG